MKKYLIKTQRIIFIIWSIVFGLFSLFGIVMIIAAIGTGMEKGFNDTDSIAILFFLLPILLTAASVYGVRNAKIDSTEKISRNKFWVKSIIFFTFLFLFSIYLSTWTGQRDGVEYYLFTGIEKIVLISIFLPFLIFSIFGFFVERSRTNH